MTWRRTADSEQDRGHHALPGEPVSPDPQPAASQAALYRPGLLSGSSAARAAAEQGRDPSGTGQMTLALRYAVRSDVGLLREGNEDSAYAGPHLLAVADGVGGNAMGEVASAETVEQIHGWVRQGRATLDRARAHSNDATHEEVRRLLESAVQSACYLVYGMGELDPAHKGMSTTLSSMITPSVPPS